MNKKYRTIKENKKGKNLKSIDITNLTPSKNRKLIQRAKKGNLPGYHVVNPGKKNEYLRSNPDRSKRNNLDRRRK